jgi:hypothetical protein
MLLDPDDTYHLNNIIKGLKFIKVFCQQQKLPLSGYLSLKTAVQYDFIVHLKDRKISIYNLFAFLQFDHYMSLQDPDLLRFTLGDVYDNIPIYRTKFLNSKYAKKIAQAGLQKIENKIKESI